MKAAGSLGQEMGGHNAGATNSKAAIKKKKDAKRMLK